MPGAGLPVQVVELAVLAVHDGAAAGQVEVLDVERERLVGARGGLIQQPPQRLVAQRDVAAAPQALERGAAAARACGRPARAGDRARRRARAAGRDGRRSAGTSGSSPRGGSRSPARRVPQRSCAAASIAAAVGSAPAASSAVVSAVSVLPVGAACLRAEVGLGEERVDGGLRRGSVVAGNVRVWRAAAEAMRMFAGAADGRCRGEWPIPRDSDLDPGYLPRRQWGDPTRGCAVLHFSDAVTGEGFRHIVYGWVVTAITVIALVCGVAPTRAAANVPMPDVRELSPAANTVNFAPVVFFRLKTILGFTSISVVVWDFGPMLRRYPLELDGLVPGQYAVRVDAPWVRVPGGGYQWWIEATAVRPDGTSITYETERRTLVTPFFDPQCDNQFDDDGDGLADDGDPQCRTGDVESLNMAVIARGHACAGRQWNGYWTNLSARATRCRVARSVMRRYANVAYDVVPQCVGCVTSKRLGNWGCTSLLVDDASDIPRVQALRVTCSGSWRQRIRFWGVHPG